MNERAALPLSLPSSFTSEWMGAAPLLRERECALGTPLHVLPSVTSTNDEARRAAQNGAPHGSTWVAETQTAGRGRRGREWVSRPGEGLLLSVLLRVRCAPSRLPHIALLAGLAVMEGILLAVPGVDVRIKWPNDVVVDMRKLAGVLVEAVTVGSHVDAVVVGIGLNVHTRSFPPHLANKATSLALVSGGGVPDRARLLVDVLSALGRDLHVVETKGFDSLHHRLDQADALRGRRVRSESEAEGVACGIDREGRLLVRTDGGLLLRWGAGEVELAKV
jgi:BirA family biotin operon repressor/biotin-[acetyl-CoA-carboxylase] ligase